MFAQYNFSLMHMEFGGYVSPTGVVLDHGFGNKTLKGFHFPVEAFR